MSNNILTGYHGTNIKNAVSIVRNNFTIPEKKAEAIGSRANSRFYTYWLGRGVYFFEDIEVAKWWSKKPTSTFGATGSPTIVKAQINTSDKTWDLRKVSTWRKIIKVFDEYMEVIGSKIVGTCQENKSNTHNLLRCAFFTWFKSTYNVDIIIAAFNQKEFQYLSNGDYEISEFLDLYYTEVQYCVFNTDCISYREIMEGDLQ